MNDFITLPSTAIDPALRRAQSLVGTSAGRPDGDWYPTPPIAVEKLLEHETFDGTILEPACGDGAISSLLLARDMPVVSTDLYDRGFGEFGLDFTSPEYPYSADNVITNPPYSLCDEFIESSLQRATKKVCLLTKLQILEGGKRRGIFERSPLARVWVFSKRLTLTRNGQPMNHGGMIAFCWIVFDHGYVGKPTLGWL